MIPEPVVTYHVRNGRRWELMGDWIATIDGHTIVVFAGFRFDLASIPRVLWWLVAPFELSIAAPLVHDHGYRHAWASRREIDRLFRVVMRLEGVGWVRRWAAWLAVRGFGWLAWRASRAN